MIRAVYMAPATSSEVFALAAAVLLLSACSREPSGTASSAATTKKTEPLASFSGATAPGGHASARLTAKPTCYQLPQHEYVACNAKPRYKSMPDCVSYGLYASSPANDRCVPGPFTLAISVPQSQGIEIPVEVGPGSADGEHLIKAATRFRAGRDGTAGTLMGKLSTAPGRPPTLIFGPGLLPSEVGQERAAALEK